MARDHAYAPSVSMPEEFFRNPAAWQHPAMLIQTGWDGALRIFGKLALPGGLAIYAVLSAALVTWVRRDAAMDCPRAVVFALLAYALLYSGYVFLLGARVDGWRVHVGLVLMLTSVLVALGAAIQEARSAARRE